MSKNHINYPRIANALYRQPWCIEPSMHKHLANVFESHVKGAAPIAAVIGGDQEPEPEKTYSVAQAVAVIPVWGVISKHLSQIEKDCTDSVDLNDIVGALKEAAADPSITGIILYFNSPGGTVTGVPETAALIKEIDAKKPVVAYTDATCASAAYWLASQCRAFYCAPSSHVGSIGCYMVLLDESAYWEREGVKFNPIVSQGSDLKIAGASFKPLTDDERAMFQKQVNKIKTQFVSDITANRQPLAEALDGRCFDGEEAVNLGLCDGLALDIEQALQLFT